MKLFDVFEFKFLKKNGHLSLNGRFEEIVIVIAVCVEVNELKKRVFAQFDGDKLDRFNLSWIPTQGTV